MRFYEPHLSRVATSRGSVYSLIRRVCNYRGARNTAAMRQRRKIKWRDATGSAPPRYGTPGRDGNERTWEFLSRRLRARARDPLLFQRYIAGTGISRTLHRARVRAITRLPPCRL